LNHPAYNLDDLVKVCGEGSDVYISHGALQTAGADFGLITQEEVIAFIANDGLECPVHANTARWKNDPKPSRHVLVDSYDFFSGPKMGYIAFFRSPDTGKWIVKSFKQNDKADQRNLIFAEFFKLPPSQKKEG